MSAKKKTKQHLVIRVDLKKLIRRYEEHQSAIGNDIRLTQALLQEETGVSQATISHWINGYRTRIDLKAAAQFLAFFRQIFPDVSVNDLLTETVEDIEE
jgi:transcriptional regulator with XRE-family HTH domain